MAASNLRPTVHLTAKEVERLAYWARWNGRLALIFACLTGLTLIGLPIAWIPFWQSRVIADSVDSFERFMQTGEDAALTHALDRSGFQFVLQVAFFAAGLMYGALLLVLTWHWVSPLLQASANA